MKEAALDRIKMDKLIYLERRYRLDTEVGQGSMAFVYHAVDLESRHPVAVKLFHSQLAADPRFAVRFRECLKSITGLEHPHLVTILDYGLVGDKYYMAMEWIQGLNLSTYLAEYGPLAPSLAIHLTRQCCLAIEAIHQWGFTHRGLKPENILLRPNGQVKVTDMGLSSLLSETGLSKTNVMLNGVSYISPEQARGEPAGPESDIYSLGVILFQMLTNRLPFESNNIWSIVSMHAEETPLSPRQLNPQVPEVLSNIVEKALQKKRDDRFTTIGEMNAALSVLPLRNDSVWGAASFQLPLFDESQLSVHEDTGRIPKLFGKIQARFSAAANAGQKPRFVFLLPLLFVVSFMVTFVYLFPTSNVRVGNAPPAIDGSLTNTQPNEVISESLSPSTAIPGRTPDATFTIQAISQPSSSSTPTPVSSVTRLLLIDAITDRPLGTLQNGQEVDLSDLPTTRLDVKAEVGSSRIESVIFQLDGRVFCLNGKCYENSEPYAMAGDLNGDHHHNWDWSDLTGQHTITAVACENDNGQPPCGPPYSITITVVP